MKQIKNITLADLKSNPDMLLSTAQVKQVLGVSDPTLYRWRKLQLITCYKVGGVFKYMAKDIDKFLNENIV